jgi:hypothetical protein
MKKDRAKSRFKESQIQLIPLSSGDFLQVEILTNSDVRMLLRSSDFKHIKLAKYFVNFSLPHNRGEDELRILKPSNGKLVMSCELDKSTRVYVFDAKLNQLCRRDLTVQFLSLTANKRCNFPALCY